MVFKKGNQLSPDRKPERNQAIILISKFDPPPKLAEIGKVFGISRQRVFQILKNGR